MSNNKNKTLNYEKKLELINRFNKKKLGVNLANLNKTSKAKISREFNKIYENIPPEKYQNWVNRIRRFETFHSPRKKNFNKNEKLHILERWEELKHLNKLKVIKVSAKEKKEFARRGVLVVEKGVLVDELRNAQGVQIENSKVTILKSGIIKETINQRKVKIKIGKNKYKTKTIKGMTTYIVTFTPEEKAEFISAPKDFVVKILKRYKELNKFKPNDFKHKSGKKISFQVGAYGSRAYDLNKLEQYVTEQAEGKDTGRMSHFLENITGIRFTIYKK